MTEDNDMITWPWDTVLSIELDTGKVYIDNIEVYYDAANQVWRQVLRPLGK